VSVFALLIPLIFLFPDGRLPSPRWPPAPTALVRANGCLLFWMLSPGPLHNYNYSRDIAARNPFGIPGAARVCGLAGALGWVAMLSCVAIAAAALIVRFRRSRGRER
jgi:hypothetical protein